MSGDDKLFGSDYDGIEDDLLARTRDVIEEHLKQAHPPQGNEKVWKEAISLRADLETAKQMGAIHSASYRALVKALLLVERNKSYRIDEESSLEAWLVEKMEKYTPGSSAWSEVAFVVKTLLPSMQNVMGENKSNELLSNAQIWGKTLAIVPTMRQVINTAVSAVSMEEAEVINLEKELQTAIYKFETAKPKDRNKAEEFVKQVEETLEIKKAELPIKTDEISKKVENVIKSCFDLASSSLPREEIRQQAKSLLTPDLYYGNYFYNNADNVTVVIEVPHMVFNRISNKLHDIVKLSVTDPLVVLNKLGDRYGKNKN